MHCVPYWRLSAYYFFYFGFLGVFAPYFGLYLQSLSFSAWEIGVIMSQMQFMRLFGPYLWGALADRRGRRLPVIHLTGIVGLIAFSGFFFADRMAAFLLTMSVLAFFWSGALPLVEALTFDHLRENPAGYSAVRVWGSVGFIAAVLGMGALLDTLPLVSLLWACLVMLVGIVAAAAVIPDIGSSHPSEHAVPITRILGEVRVRALFAACFAMAAAHGALNIFYTIFLTEHGYSKSAAGGLFSLGVLAEIAVFLIMTRVMRRFSLRRILLVSFATAAIRFVLVAWGVGSLALLVITQLMHGLTFGACHASAIAAINQWFPGNTRSRGQALYSSICFGAGGLVGGLVSGWCWDHLGGAAAFASSSVYAVLGFFLVARWVGEDALARPAEARAVDSASELS